LSLWCGIRYYGLIGSSTGFFCPKMTIRARGEALLTIRNLWSFKEMTGDPINDQRQYYGAVTIVSDEYY
jgi:hypothetical protein